MSICDDCDKLCDEHSGIITGAASLSGKFNVLTAVLGGLLSILIMLVTYSQSQFTAFQKEYRAMELRKQELALTQAEKNATREARQLYRLDQIEEAIQSLK